MNPRAFRTTLLVLLIVGVAVAAGVFVAACGSSGSSNASTGGGKTPDFKQLIVATTTSLKDSGLLDDVVVPAFKELHPDITVKIVAQGSGAAIEMARAGNADVLLVHSPADEEQFMADGQGTLRLPFAYNYFTIVGPPNDPAKVADAPDAATAFKQIYDSGAPFVSRGDGSGTNSKELKLWNAAGVTTDPKADPDYKGYIKTSQGMAQTLQIANEKDAYTLTDMATYLSLKSTLPNLKPLLKESADLKNQYDVILINQALHTQVNAPGAEFLAAYLVSPEGQKAIGAYGKDKYGQALFTPDASSLGTISQ
jgi:tungstate transport system substrate-binding protein